MKSKSSAKKLFGRLSRLNPMAGEPPTIRPLLTRAEIALILSALRGHYELDITPVCPNCYPSLAYAGPIVYKLCKACSDAQKQPYGQGRYD